MRKVVLIMTASIDGFVAAPTGLAVGGLPEPAELKRWKLERIRRAGTHIMGRVSYEEMGTLLAILDRRLRGTDERYPQSSVFKDT